MTFLELPVMYLESICIVSEGYPLRVYRVPAAGLEDTHRGAGGYAQR